MAEWTDAAKAYLTDRAALADGLAAYLKKFAVSPAPTFDVQHAARQAFDPLAAAERGLVKQIDLLYKLAARAAHLAQELATDEAASELFDRRATGKLIKQLDEERKAAVEQTQGRVYFHRQIAWLQDRFPQGRNADVPGLCKVVSRAEIAAADWSLTPGRYVGVAPAEVDEDFDFEQTLRDIHVELADLNREAVELAAKIQENFEELGV
jgi:type I restriction enzyme M protein